MEFTARQLAELLGGSLVGDPQKKITSLSKIEDGQDGSITFLANPKYESFVYSTGASAILVSKSWVMTKPVTTTLIFVDDAYTAFSILLEKFNGAPGLALPSGLEQPCFVDPSAQVGEDCYIGAFAYIGKQVILGKGTKVYPQVYIGDRVSIGEQCIIYPGVKIYENCTLGRQVIIHSGTVIGSDGFGFAPQPDGRFTKIIQSGNVVIDDEVEIGSNTCIDRATIGSTHIRKGVKLDNLIQIAHNVDIGRDTVIAAQTGISGSTKIGENCVFGGQVGVVGHVSIGNKNQFGAKSGISKTITEEGKQFRGVPLQAYKESLKTEVFLRNLPKLEKRIAELERLVERIRLMDPSDPG